MLYAIIKWVNISKYLPVIITLASFFYHAHARCQRLDASCDATVVCVSEITPLDLPACLNPNFTLLIQNFPEAINLNSDFFRASNFRHHIRAIKAVNNRWLHIAPFTFDFSHCTHMDLSRNGIKTVHPNSFSNTIFLKELNLSRNFMKWDLRCDKSAVVTGEPMNSLTVLDMSFNSMGNNDISFEKMTCFPVLEKLYLNNNQFSNLLSDTLAPLHNLRYLNLNNNEFTTLHGLLPNLYNLRILDMSFNRVKYINTYDFGYTSSLEQILLSHNDIEHTDSAVFDHMSNLNMVDLSHNRIILLDLSFNENLKLKSLNFHNNSLVAIKITFSPYSEDLVSIDLSSNALGVVPVGSINNAHNLVSLNLSFVGLTRLNDDSLRGFNNLTVLDLSHNKLVEIGAEELHYCNNLQMLVIDDNYLKEFDFEPLLGVVPRLEMISVGENLIPCEELVKYYNESARRGVRMTAKHLSHGPDSVFGISCYNSTKLSVTKPTSLVTMPTLAVTKPTVAVTKTTIAVTKLTSVVTKPTLRVIKPTLVVTKPTLIVTKSTVGVTKPTFLFTKPTLAVSKPTLVVTKSTLGVTKPTSVATKPTLAVTEPAIVITKPTFEVTKPTSVVTKPTSEFTKPTVVTKPSLAVTKPTLKVTKPVLVDTEVTKPSVVITKPTLVVTDPTIEVTAVTESRHRTHSVVTGPITANTKPVPVVTEPGTSSSQTVPNQTYRAKQPESLTDFMNVVMIWAGLMSGLIILLVIFGAWTCTSKLRAPRRTYDMRPSDAEIPLACTDDEAGTML